MLKVEAGAAYTKGSPGDEAVDAIESSYDPVDGSMPKADGLKDDDCLYKREDDVSLGTFLHASVLLFSSACSHIVQPSITFRRSQTK